MIAGPVRRLVGTLGLIALTPTAVMLVRGDVGPAEAATRAGITLGAALVGGRALTWWLVQAARRGRRR